MSNRTGGYLLVAAALFAVPAAMISRAAAAEAGQTAATTQATHVLGRVYGKTITAAGVGLTGPIDTATRFDSRNREQWELMTRISRAFGEPVNRKFASQHHLQATAEELAMFSQTLKKQSAKHLKETEEELAKIKTQLMLADLPADKAAELKQKEGFYERSLKGLREQATTETSEEIRGMFIASWKEERELHRKYGGRVIFQQFGLEALDARRKLYEEAEAKGELVFDDTSVRHLFYYYWNMKHTDVDAALLERPWFFGDEQPATAATTK